MVLFKTSRRHLAGALQPVVRRVIAIALDEVQRVSVARFGRTIREAHVREQAVKDDERALLNFERDELT